MLIWLREKIKEESGQSLVLVAAVLIGLLGFGALVTDVGFMYYQKSYLQNAADAAALAGALSMVVSNTAAYNKALEYIQLNLQNRGSYTYTITPDGTNHTVYVEITQTAPKFLAGVFTSKTSSMTAHATAKCYGWFGNALPLLNLVQNYSIENILSLWSKQGPGDFGRINDSDITIMNQDDPNTIYFTVNWQDGFITYKKGVDATVKQEIEDVVTRDSYEYVFSLSQTVIDSGKYSKIKNADLIPLEDLVLLKVTPVNYDLKNVQVKVVDIYTYDAITKIFESSTNSASYVSTLIQ